MQRPQLSVIIPTYNAEKTVVKAIDSVRSQTFNNWELLVMDGASADNTLSLINKTYATDPRIHIHSAKDGGIYQAMNNGIRKAKGDWLYFLGADDCLFDNSVFNNIFTVANENKNAELIYGNVSLNKPIGYHHQGLIYAGEFDADTLLKKNLCHQSAFYHKSLFEKFGLFQSKYKIFADYDFNLRCFNKVTPKFTNAIIANFNVGGNSKENQQLDRQFENDFLKNMVFNYPYCYKHDWFNGKKMQVFSLLLKPQNLLKPGGFIKAIRIIFHQTISKKNKHTLA